VIIMSHMIKKHACSFKTVEVARVRAKPPGRCCMLQHPPCQHPPCQLL
jgi:hypothetical protein